MPTTRAVEKRGSSTVKVPLSRMTRPRRRTRSPASRPGGATQETGSVSPQPGEHRVQVGVELTEVDRRAQREPAGPGISRHGHALSRAGTGP